MAELFISYRRGDPNAHELERQLERRFYKGVTFLDVASPTTGDLEQVLTDELKKSNIVLVLITKLWIEMAKSGKLEQSSDPVTMELNLALAEKKRVIPVFQYQDAARELGELEKNRGNLATTAALAAQLRKLMWIDVRVDVQDQYESDLETLYEKLEPHLAGYWKFVSEKRRQELTESQNLRKKYQILAIRRIVYCVLLCAAFAAILVLMFLSKTDLAIRDRLLMWRIVYPNDKPIPLAPVPNTPAVNKDSPDVDKLKGLGDYWTMLSGYFVNEVDRFNASQDPTHWKRKKLYVVQSPRFTTYYKTFSAGLSVKSDLRIIKAFAFLGRNDGPLWSYHPVYRDVNVNVQRQELVHLDAPQGGIPQHELTIPDPNEDEYILLILYVEGNAPGVALPPDPGAKLEVR